MIFGNVGLVLNLPLTSSPKYATITVEHRLITKNGHIQGRGRTPIEKNVNSAKQTVLVSDENGTQVGLTYPKRAAGLVKKGRARYVNDREIRLDVSDVTIITEETKMDNNNIITQNEDRGLPYTMLYFNTREWHFNKECKDNTGSRSFMTGPDGALTEAFTIGNWSWNWTEICSKQLILAKNTPHMFTFWLNGGENDRNNEVCRFEVIFNNDHENRYTYNLNRSFIQPVKRLNGWELYEIPFITGDNEYTELRFVAQYAYMTVMAAKDKFEYAEFPDTADEFADERPQRHNIVFQDGWPTDKWYSTKNLRAQREQREQRVQQNGEQPAYRDLSGAMTGMTSAFNGLSGALDVVNCTLEGVPQMVEGSIKSACDMLRRKITETAVRVGANDPDELAETVCEEFNDRLSNAINDNISAMTDEVNDLLGDIQGTLEDLRDMTEELSED